MAKITYRNLAGYKYGLMEPYSHETGVTLDAAVVSRQGWVKMSRSGRLTTKKGLCLGRSERSNDRLEELHARITRPRRALPADA